MKSPNDRLELRPTQDRVREALFSILMHDISGARFLDLFAGSGAVGFEALSRGASSATFVEINQEHISFIKANAKALDVNPSVINTDAYRYVETFRSDPFDIAYADPPYVQGEKSGFNRMIESAANNNLIRSGGLFIIETTQHTNVEETSKWDLCRDRTYGKTRLMIFKRH